MEMCLEFLWLSDKKINFSSNKKEFPGLMKTFNDKCVLWKTVKRKFHFSYLYDAIHTAKMKYSISFSLLFAFI